jgi:hypothetical protein
MKKIMLVFLLIPLLFAAFPFASLAEDLPAAVLEESVCEAYDPALLGEGELLTELPDWLAALIFNDGSAVGGSLVPAQGFTYASLTTAQTTSFYAPRLYEPYTVKKTKTYYNKNGDAAYALILSAVFVDTNAGTTCLRTNADYRIYRGSWRITPGAPEAQGRMVTAAFTVEQLFTGIAIKTDTVTVTLFSYDRGGKSYIPGDLNGDGRVTTGDARAALRIAVNLEPQTDYSLCIADLNGDGELTTADARGVLRKAVGLPARQIP